MQSGTAPFPFTVYLIEEKREMKDSGRTLFQKSEGIFRCKILHQISCLVLQSNKKPKGLVFLWLILINL